MMMTVSSSLPPEAETFSHFKDDDGERSDSTVTLVPAHSNIHDADGGAGLLGVAPHRAHLGFCDDGRAGSELLDDGHTWASVMMAQRALGLWVWAPE